jgi:hypothetical protein
MLSIFLALSALAQSTPRDCDPLVTDLMAGQHHKAGTVTVTNSGDVLRIDVEIPARWVTQHNARLWAVHIYAGFGPPPTNPGGNVAPGQFPYKTDYPLGVASHTQLIPLADFGGVCGDTVQIAVHTELSCNLHGNETGWAMGQHPFGGGQWGWWLDSDICCGNQPARGMDLDVSPLLLGGTANFTATGAQPAELVTFYRSSKPILMGSGVQRPVLGATILDIQAPISAVGSDQADGNGVATLSKTIPAQLGAGRVFAFQAVVLRTPDAFVSNAVYGVTQ